MTGTFDKTQAKYNILPIDMSKGNQCEFVEQEKIVLLYGNYSNWIRKCKISPFKKLFYTFEEQKIKRIIESGSNAHLEKLFIKDLNKKIQRASFLSTGPGNKGIMKPDVMAPGSRIISAKSNEHSNSPHGCLEDFSDDYSLKDGTSMATPNVAGGMALIHQYFNSGRWIQNVKLDATTSRALIINSCKHPYGSKKPDIIFGHGDIDLSTILPIENDFGVQITHQNHDKTHIKKHSVVENGHDFARLHVNSSLSKNKLQITLSYLDPLLDIESPFPITRDLDIIVISPSKQIYIGDHLETKDTQHFSTNEKVIINEHEVENGEYSIHVFWWQFC